MATAAGKVGTASDFELTNVEWLSRVDEALLSAGDIDYTWAVWLQLESKPATTNLYGISKAGGSGADTDNTEYAVIYRNIAGQDRFTAFIGNAGSYVIVQADTFGSPSTATWYYVQAQHNASANTLRIRINDGAWDSLATGSVTPPDTTGALNLGAFHESFNWDGLINQAAFWKAIKSDADLNSIYNGGNGLAFASWDVSTRVPLDLTHSPKHQAIMAM